MTFSKFESSILFKNVINCMVMRLSALILCRKKGDVGFAYLFSVLSYVLAILPPSLFLGEAVSFLRLARVSVICLGVLIIAGT